MEIQYIASRRDVIEQAAFLKNEFGCAFFADHSSAADPALFSDGALHSSILSTSVPGLVHVVSPIWSSASIEMSGPFIPAEGESYWYVAQRHGGPAFLWSLPGECQDGERKWLRLGSFGCWPTYYFGAGNIEQPRPATMAKAFQRLANWIRRRSRRARWKTTGGAGPWISTNAIDLSNAGYSVIEGLGIPGLSNGTRPVVLSPTP